MLARHPPLLTLGLGALALSAVVGIAALELVRGDLAALASSRAVVAPGDAGAVQAIARTRARARHGQYALLALTTVALGLGAGIALRRGAALAIRPGIGAHAAFGDGAGETARAWRARGEVLAVADELTGQAAVIGRAASRLLAGPGRPGDLELVRIQNAAGQLERLLATLGSRVDPRA